MSEQLSFDAAAAGGATLSPCGTYRYRLWRRWGDGPHVLFCMLNPSTADANADDPTIRKCVGFAKRWGFTGIEVVNLFAFRATDPTDLVRAFRACRDVTGPGNPEYVRHAATLADKLIAAWGAHADGCGIIPETVTSVLARWGDVWCLGRSKSGQPRHPLMLAYETPLEIYRAREVGL